MLFFIETDLGVLAGGELDEGEAAVGASADPGHLLRQSHRAQLAERPAKTAHMSCNVLKTAHVMSRNVLKTTRVITSNNNLKTKHVLTS